MSNDEVFKQRIDKAHSKPRHIVRVTAGVYIISIDNNLSVIQHLNNAWQVVDGNTVATFPTKRDAVAWLLGE